MYTEGHEGRSRGIAAITKDAVSADRRVGVSASLQPRRSERMGACANSPALIAITSDHVGPFFGHATPDRAGARPYRVRCRVARCGMGLSAHTPSSPFASFRVFRGPWV